MLRPSQQSSGHALRAFHLLAGVLVVSVAGCAQKTSSTEAEHDVTPEVEPQAAPQEITPQADSVSVFAGTSQEVEKRQQEPVEALLSRTSGVIVSVDPSGTISVRIRGATSFYGSGAPLYVVDGVPVRPGPGGTLRGISPHDIQSIRVLKGPPETTLYGARGANGVILIKTIRPD